jgi:hypothetical protein
MVNENMELYARQQFDFFLMTAAERFSERIVQRCAGTENALKQLKEDPNGEGIWLDQYVESLFEDFLYNNTGGACFILSALEKRDIEIDESGKVEQVLQKMAQKVFAELLLNKSIESLERSVGFGS